MTTRTFTYDGRVLEVNAKKSASGHTWSVQVSEAGQPANGAIYVASTELVADAARYGVDILQELAATAESDFKRWSSRMRGSR